MGKSLFNPGDIVKIRGSNTTGVVMDVFLGVYDNKYYYMIVVSDVSKNYNTFQPEVVLEDGARTK
ncbi:MAG: hypothetical protein WC716_16535 [Chitinophagaceae bacterium]|jgi:hypothetical protein